MVINNLLQGKNMTNKQYVVYLDARGYPNVIDEMIDGKTYFARDSLEQVQVRYPGARMMDEETVLSTQESLNKTEPVRISEYAFFYGLEALPPVRWINTKHVETFEFLERYSGRITDIYARVGSEFWSFRDVHGISQEEIIARIDAAKEKYKTVTHYGLSYTVKAWFRESDTDGANDFMGNNPGTSVLCAQNGIAFVVDTEDAGAKSNDKKDFVVSLSEDPGDKLKLHFECSASSAEEACDMAEDHYPGSVIHHAGEKP